MARDRDVIPRGVTKTRETRRARRDLEGPKKQDGTAATALLRGAPQGYSPAMARSQDGPISVL